jgi:NitT/TauT family transport system substrate-binding protein
MNRVSRLLALVLAALLLVAVGVSGCGEPAASETAPTSTTATRGGIALRIGTLPTEDSLPLWVAQQKDYFQVNSIPKVDIVEFQSAQERDAAFASGAIDAYMGDIIAAANLAAAGKKGVIQTVMLGADKTQGRFGIAVAPDSKITTASELANVPVGTSSATIQEYVLDRLLNESKVPTASIKVEEVKKVPVRYQLLMAGKLKAAALPEPFLTLAALGGAKIVADDTKSGSNLSQTVLVLSSDYMGKTGGASSAAGLGLAWDAAVADINANPAAYRQLLVDKAKLPQPLAATYKVNTYPTYAVPAPADVQPVLDWMKAKGYLKADVTYTDLTGKPAN